MRFLCARQAWHDAFMTDLAAPDFATQAAGVGVQFSARGADNKIVDHCERGFIQQAIAILRERDVVAHAWGMIAYAPQGVATMGDFSVMFGHLRTAFFSRLPPESELLKLRYNPEFERILKLLIKIAVIDAGAEDARRGQKDIIKVFRRLTADLAQLISVDHGEYQGKTPEKFCMFFSGVEDHTEYSGKWHKWYRYFKNACEDLPRRSLGIVAAEVNKRKKPGEAMLTPDIQHIQYPPAADGQLINLPAADTDSQLIDELIMAIKNCEHLGEAKQQARRVVGTLGLRK